MKTKALTLITLLSLLIVSVSMAGASPQGSPAPQGEPQRYVFVVFTAGNEFFNMAKTGADDAINVFHLNAVAEGPLGPTDWNAEQQLNILDQVTATGPTGIILSAADAQTIVPGIERAVEAGIVVQSFDLRPETPLADFVGTDFREMGRVAGERIVELCEPRIEDLGVCKLGITEVGGAYQTALRNEGLHSVLDSHPDIKIVAQVDDGGLTDRALDAASQILAANPDVNILLCQHGQGAAAFAAAIKGAGLEPNKDVFVIGNDLGTTTLQCIQDGECDSTVGQDPYTMGYYAMLNAYSRANSGMPHTIFPGKDGVDWINPGTNLVTRDTVDELLTRVETIASMYR